MKAKEKEEIESLWGEIQNNSFYLGDDELDTFNNE